MEDKSGRLNLKALMQKVVILFMAMLIWVSTPLTILFDYGVTTVQASGVQGVTHSYNSKSWGTSLAGGAITLDKVAYKVSISRDVGLLNTYVSGNYTHRKSYNSHSAPSTAGTFYVAPSGYGTFKTFLRYDGSTGSIGTYDDSSLIYNNTGAKSASNSCKALLKNYSSGLTSNFTALADGKWKSIASQCTNGEVLWSYLANSQGDLDKNLRVLISSHSNSDSLTVEQRDDIKRGYLGILFSTYTMIKNDTQKSFYAQAIEDYITGVDENKKPVSLVIEPAVMITSRPLGISAGIVPAVDLLEFTTNVSQINRLSNPLRTPDNSPIPADVAGDTVKMAQFLYKRDLIEHWNKERIANVSLIKNNFFSHIMGLPLVKKSRLTGKGSLGYANKDDVKYYAYDGDTTEFMETMTYLENIKGYITVGIHGDKPTPTIIVKPKEYELTVTPKLEVSPEMRTIKIPYGYDNVEIGTNNTLTFRLDENKTSIINWQEFFNTDKDQNKTVKFLLEITRTAKTSKTGNNVQGKGVKGVGNQITLGVEKDVDKKSFLEILSGDRELVFTDDVFYNLIHAKEKQQYDYQMFITVKGINPTTGKVVTTGKTPTNKVTSIQEGIPDDKPLEKPILSPYLIVNPEKTVVDFGSATSGTKKLGKNINIHLRLKSLVAENKKWDVIMESPYNVFVDVYVGMERNTMMVRQDTDKNQLTSAHPVTGEHQIVPGNYKQINKLTWETLRTDNHYFNFTDHVTDNLIEYGERQVYYYTFSYGLRYNDHRFLTREVSVQTDIFETSQGISEFTTTGNDTGENYNVGSIDPKIAVDPASYEMASGVQPYKEKLPRITIFEDTSSIAHTQSISAWNTLEQQVTKFGTIDVGIRLNREASNEREQYTHLYPWNKQGETLKWTWSEFKAFLNGEKTIQMTDRTLENTRLGTAKEIHYNYSANITAKVPMETKTGKKLTVTLSKNTNTDSILYFTCQGTDNTYQNCVEGIPTPPPTPPIDVDDPVDTPTDGGGGQKELLELSTPKKNIVVFEKKLRHDVDIFIRDSIANESQMFIYDNQFKDVDQFKVKIDLERFKAPQGVKGAEYLFDLGTIGQEITLDRETYLTFLRGESEFRIKDKTYENPVQASVDQEYHYRATVTVKFDYTDFEGKKQTLEDIIYTNQDYSNFLASDQPAPEKPELIIYNNKSVQYSEIKQDADGQKFGTTANEEFDAMAGVPSNKRLYYSVGGTEFVVDVELEYRQNIWSDWRTYHSYFTQVESEHMQQDRADEVQTVPSPTGASSSDLTVTPHGGDLTITATWTGTTPYTGDLAWSDHSVTGADKWDDKPYETAKGQAEAWISAVSAFQLKNYSASEGQEKTWNAWTSEAGLGIKLDTNPHPAGWANAGQPEIMGSCGDPPSPCVKQAYVASSGQQGTDGTYTITVSATIPAHTVCGPECQYILPQVNDTWKQRVAFDYMKVVKVDIYKLTEGRLTKVDNVFGEGNSVISSKIVNGEQQLFANIAQMNANNIADGVNAAKREADGTRTWDKSALSKQGSTVQSSKYGRLRYSLEPLQHDKVTWNEGVRTNKSAGVNDGTSTDGWNGTKYSSAIGQDHANAKGIKYNNNGYTTLYDFHDRECSEQFVSTSDCATSVDKQTPEWKKFEERRTTKNVATVISDMLILQTSHGDQAIIYFEKDTVEAEAQQQWTGLRGELEGQEALGHVERIKVSKREMWEENKNSAFDWSVNKVNVGSYNGKYSQPSQKYDGYNVEDGTVSANHTGIVETKFDKINGDPVTRKRSKTDTQRLEIYKTMSIVPTIPNGEYMFGLSQVFYHNILRFESSNPFVDYSLDGSKMDVEPYIYEPFSSKQSNFESKEGLVYNAPYSDLHNRINNVVIHTPVSTEYAIVISEDANKDQRIDMPEGGASALNEEKNKLRVCPLDPADCQFRVLNCKHTEDAILSNFDFSSVGQYEITNKATGTGVLYNATNGITFSGGKMVAKGTRFSVNFADIGLINRRSVTVGVRMDLAVPTGITQETMIASFDKYGVVYNPVSNRIGFLVDDTNMVRYGNYDLKGKTVKIELQMSLGSVLDSNIVIKGNTLPMTNTTTYPKDLVGLVGNTINIGSWKQNANYPANFTVDNLEIIKKGGTDQHTESCYIYTEEHAESYIHIHTESCYVMDENGNRKQICNGVGQKEMSDKNVHIHDESCLVSMAELEKIFGATGNQTTTEAKVFSYTGNVQEFVAPADGTYQLEVWGASGGNGGSDGQTVGGKGGYSKGEVTLKKGEKLNIYVGGKGTDGGTNHAFVNYTWINGGWNGGGNNYTAGGGGAGGGATDIRKDGTSLGNRIIVAGGGGGSGWTYNGGAGGGLTGLSVYDATGGTQTTGGNMGTGSQATTTTNGSLGQGGIGSGHSGGGGAGGGGYYGGGGSGYQGGGGGGSSYVGTLQNSETKTGNDTQPTTSGGTQTGQTGNGVAKITPLQTSSSLMTANGIGDLTWQQMLGGRTDWQNYVKVEKAVGTGTPTKYNYTGNVQTFTAPVTGEYTFKVVGASGGGNAGKGGQATGTKKLNKGDVINIYVGGTTTTTSGGWNGGGSTGSPAYGGGGASDIRINGNTLADRIIVGAGGGGGQAGFGGDGGGLTGATGTGGHGTAGTGGTQTSGGTGGSSGTLGKGGNGQQGGDGYYGGAGGGGYYGGGGAITDVSLVDDKGGGGGSSYYGGVDNGATQAGVNTGNGYVEITVPKADVVTIDMDKIKNIVSTLPTEVNGKINPLFVKDLLNYNKHQHTGACKVIKVLACTEPHHDGGHYDGSNSICWDACRNDELHKQTSEVVKVGENGDVETMRMATFLNLDEDFQIYYPNRGNFEQAPNMLGIGQTTATRGKGYYDNMDLTQYTRAKRVKFPFNVTHKGKLYTAHTWIDLEVREEFFDFRLVLANNEASAAEIEFDVIAINAQAPQAPSNDNDEFENNQDRNALLAAKHGGIKRFYMDVVGRIGNFAVVDTEDLRFANLFKESALNGSYLIEGVVPQVNSHVQRKYYGDTVDIRGVAVGQTGVGLNTYGYVKYLEKQPLQYPINPKDHAVVGNNPVLFEEFLKPGYDVIGEIQTTGDYQKGTIRILPYYFKVNTKTNEIIPLDAYVLTGNGYELVHEYKGADDGVMPNLTDYSVVMDWANEANRRNYNVEESNITNVVAERLGKLIYGNYITESGLTANGAINVEKLELPIGNYTTLGNAQRVVLNGYMRTFIGSNLTYGVNHNPDDLNGNGIEDDDENWRLGDYLWHGEAQRWHMKLGLPSSTIFVEHGVTPNEDTINAIKETEGVVVMTADIIAIGALYTLRYTQPGLTEFTVKVNGQTKTFNVADLGLPPIIGLMDAKLTASTDVSVQSTH